MAKILYISFGYLPYWSGGMVKNQLGLMKNLMKVGHDVTYFTACRYDFKKKPYLSQREINSVPSVELVNSPNVYDPYCYGSDPRGHCENKVIEHFTMKVTDTVKPDIVHISDLRMHCPLIIRLFWDKKIPVFKTMHNYWDLCPKGDLMYEDKELCRDFEEGKKCLKCLSPYVRTSIPFLHRVKGSFHYQRYYPLVQKMSNIKTLLSKKRTPGRSIPSSFSSNAYAQRRKYFISMLNQCTAVHTTSKKIAQRFIDYGVHKSIVRTIPLSAEGLTKINAKNDYKPRYPITFGYRGKVHSRKGMRTLLSAFNRLDASKVRLLIFGDGDIEMLSPYQQKNDSIIFRGRYNKNEINEVLAEIDIGIVPSIWEEIFGIVGPEYINARIPVIASDIGGISEWLHDGENGYLFPPGDENALFKIMNRFIEKPQLIADLQKTINPWKTVFTYAQEISEMYNRYLR